jgi:hypothetical protein
MKTLQQLFAAILLALALGIPTFAGDMGGPTTINSPAPLPTDSIPAVTTAPTPTAPDETGSPAVLALNFLLSALSMY